MLGGLYGYCVDEWVKGPSGACCIFHQKSWRFPLCIHHHKRGHDIGTNKGVAMVIMERQDYINNPKYLFNQPTYRAIPQDPTNTIKNKLINILKRVKNQTGLDNVTYKSMYPTGCVPPNSMGSLTSTNWTHH